MATLDELTVKIKADATQFDREINRVGNSAGRVTSAFGGLKGQFVALAGALAAVKLVTFARDAVAAADALNDLSARTGVSASYLSAMRTEIENNGGSVEQFAQALFMMNRQIGEGIKDAAGPAAETLRRLGIEVADLAAGTPEDNFRTIAEAISRLPTEFERAEASAALFGRGVAGLQPIIRQGAAGIDELTAKADEFGQSLSAEQLQAIDEFGDAMNALGNRMENLASGAFANVVLAVQSIISAVGEGVDQVRLLTAGGLDALDYIDRARAGGFATTVQRGEVIGRQAYGPSRPAAASAERVRATKEIMDMATETDALSRSMQQVEDRSVVSARVIKDSFGDALESATFDFESFGDSVSRVLDGIARDIARRAFIQPLSSGVGDWLMGSGSGLPWDTGVLGDLFSGLGFAAGGRPPVGKASVVGENGPELFVPDTAGTILPNGVGRGGGSVTVVQHNNFGSGVTRQEVASMLPAVAEAAKQALIEDAQRGGRTSQILGKRN